LNALLRPTQLHDAIHELGQRSILIAQRQHLLAGFSFNRKTLFDSVVRTAIPYTLSRGTLTATLEIPELLPGIHLHAPYPHALYSFVAVLAVVPDFHHTPNGYRPDHDGFEKLLPVNVESAWFQLPKGSAPISLSLQINEPPPTDNFAIVLGIGLRYGAFVDGAIVHQVKYAGSAKVLAVM
jgi:hypothetical protein